MKLLGKKVEDKISGFRGIVVSICEYLYGCKQAGVLPRIDKDGKKQPAEWFDIGSLKIIETGIEAKEVKAEEDGAEFQDHPSI